MLKIKTKSKEEKIENQILENSIANRIMFDKKEIEINDANQLLDIEEELNSRLNSPLILNKTSVLVLISDAINKLNTIKNYLKDNSTIIICIGEE